MKNKIIKNNGKSSKIIKDDGTIEYADILPNDEGISVRGTELTEENLLSDETSELYGLIPETSTPDEAFVLLFELFEKINNINESIKFITINPEYEQSGSFTFPNLISAGGYNAYKLDFPVAFRNIPNVYVSVQRGSSSNGTKIIATTYAITKTSVTIYADSTLAQTANSFTINWRAIDKSQPPIKLSNITNFIEYFKVKKPEWTEQGGTFQYTENGLYTPDSSTKGTLTSATLGMGDAAWLNKCLTINPEGITDFSEITIDSKVAQKTRNNQTGGWRIGFFDSSDVCQFMFEHMDFWDSDANQMVRLVNPDFSVMASTGAQAYNNVDITTRLVKSSGGIKLIVNNTDYGQFTYSSINEIEKIKICAAAPTGSQPQLECTLHSLIIK